MAVGDGKLSWYLGAVLAAAAFVAAFIVNILVAVEVLRHG